MGLACPLPVIQTKKALRNIEKNGHVETLVDNESSMENLLKMAKEMGLKSSYNKVKEHEYRVVITKGEGGITTPSNDTASKEKMIIAIPSDKMGSGIDELGDVLMKG